MLEKIKPVNVFAVLTTHKMNAESDKEKMDKELKRIIGHQLEKKAWL